MNMPGLMMQLSVFPPPRARFQWRLTLTAANPAIAFQVQSPPNNSDFDNALAPFAGQMAENRLCMSWCRRSRRQSYAGCVTHSSRMTADSEAMGLVVIGPSLHPSPRRAPEWVS
jgi:hypothetical protein